MRSWAGEEGKNRATAALLEGSWRGRRAARGGGIHGGGAVPCRPQEEDPVMLCVRRGEDRPPCYIFSLKAKPSPKPIHETFSLCSPLKTVLRVNCQKAQELLCKNAATVSPETQSVLYYY